MGYYCRIFTRLHWKCRYRVGVLETASFTKAGVLSVTQSRFCRFTRGSNRTDTCSYSRKSVFWESFRDIGCAVCECFAPVPGFDWFGASLRRSLAFSSQSIASARNYIISIVMVRIGAVCLTMMPLTLLHLAGKDGRLPSYLLANTVILISLCLIIVAYLAIRKRLRSTNHTCEAHYRKSFKQNVNLSRTLFLAVGLSIGLWLPATAIYTVLAFHNKQPLSDNNILIFVATILYLGNSLVNPIVYSCRMPMFKAAVKGFLKHEVCHSNSN